MTIKTTTAKKSVEDKVEKKIAKPTVKKVTKKTVDKPKKSYILSTGRRKKSIVRVFLSRAGTGKIVVNKKDINDYFLFETHRFVIMQPLVLTDTQTKYDIIATVNGGGLAGQAGALCHGIARALVKADEMLKQELKKAGFLTRDARKKERKKYGLKKARKASQFSKR